MSRERIAIAALATASILLLGMVVQDSWLHVGEVFPGFMIWDNGMLLAFHDTSWTGTQVGLPADGRILAIDGFPFENRRSLFDYVAIKPPATEVVYEILRDGQTEMFSVPTMRLGWAGYLGTFGIYVVGATICWLVSLSVLYLQPNKADARALALMLFVIGIDLVLAIDLIATSRFGHSLALTEAFTPAAILQFTLVFPRERIGRERRNRWMVFGFAFAAAYAFVGASTFYSDPEFSRLFPAAAYLGVAISLIVAIFLLAESVLRAPTGEQRVRAAVVFLGAFIACIIPAIGVPAFLLLRWDFSWSWLFAPVALFPIAVMYGVVRHDLLGAERFIRMSLGYAVAYATATSVFALSVFVLDRTAFPDLASSSAAPLLFVLVLVASINPLLRRTYLAIDRYFYRTVSDPAEVLEQLGEDLAECEDASAIADCCASIIGEALSLEYAELELADDPARALDAEYTVGVTFRSVVMGRINCGAKRSGAPFSRVDRELIGGSAVAVGIALHNAQSTADLKEAQERLVRSERLATMGELAGSVAHGIRNPLAGIRASAQIAGRQTDDDAVKQTLAGIISESDRLEHRVRALLDFSRPFEPTVELIDVGEVVTAVVTAVASHAERIGVELVVSVDASTARVECDQNFLEEALLELAGNALRVLDERGGGKLCFSDQCVDDRVMIEVSDNGPGIPVNIRSRVFDLFFSTRPHGTGMGLATVKRIVEAMGGVIRVAESSGGGARFVIDLPHARRSA